jgi:hypothetical protein
MNEAPVRIYREQFQAAVKEITSKKGAVQKIVGNVIHFVDSAGEQCVFIPANTEGGPMFFKHLVKDLTAA